MSDEIRSLKSDVVLTHAENALCDFKRLKAQQEAYLASRNDLREQLRSGSRTAQETSELQNNLIRLELESTQTIDAMGALTKEFPFLPLMMMDEGQEG